MERESRVRGRVGRGAVQVSRFWVCVGALVAALVLSCGSAASAAQVHKLVTSFDGHETPAGSMTPFGVAVDNSGSASAGDVYVTDLGSATVEKFNATGEYLSPSITGPPGEPFSGLFWAPSAVDAVGDVFVADPGVPAVDEFSPTGEYIARKALPGGDILTALSVDGSGDILIATTQVVFKYDPGTSSLTEFATNAEGRAFESVTGVAVDDDPSSPSFGEVYIVEEASGVVYVFEASGALRTTLTDTPSGAFSFPFRDVVDPTSGDLYVATASTVDQFSPTGKFLSEIPLPDGGSPTSVAVAAKTGKIYVADASGAVDVFAPGVIIPDVSTAEAVNVQPTSATVQGEVNPAGGEVTSCEVEYGITSSYGETTECSPGLPYEGESAVKVSVELKGLNPDTVYHFRFVAGNGNGTSHSQDAMFETIGPPTIGEMSVDGVTRAVATLHGHVDPHGADTTWHFEYGTDTSYGTIVPIPDGDAGAGTTEVPVSAEVSGLTVGATYHYRLVATSEGNVVNGPDATFETHPVVAVEGLSAIAGPHDATLKYKIEDYDTSSTCELEYVTEAQFVSGGYADPTLLQCAPEQLSASEGELHVIARPTGLSSGTTYHYRLLLSNEFGEEHGPDQTFTTFGLSAFSLEDTEQAESPYVQAGGHPYAVTTTIAFNTNTDHLGNVGPAGSARDINVHLPAGLIGNPQAVAKCTRYDVEHAKCSGASQVGMLSVLVAGHGAGGWERAPLFNIAPPQGVAAEFGVQVNTLLSAIIDAAVRTGTDYGIDTRSLHITTVGPIAQIQVQIWGEPADPSHDDSRYCPEFGSSDHYESPCSASIPIRPFLTNPTSCAEQPLTAGVEADSYQAPGEFAKLKTEMPAMTGCERLHFTPTITVRPEVSAADSPSGLHVDLHIPQEESAVGLAEADLKDATVTLPKGLTVNPASAGGLTGCSEAQIELNGPAPATCPESSKVGTVELTSPLVDHPLQGAVYVAQQGNGGAAQGSNKFGSLIALYVAIDDQQTGVVVKLAGKVSLDPATGQLTTTFNENPQLPFEDLKLDFFGGPRAALETPPTCGAYTEGSASFDSWAEPSTAVTPGIQPFVVSSGPGGSPCPSGAFAPAFTAGTESSQAGAYTPFVLSFARQDGEQGIGGLEATLAPGLLGKLAGIPQCGAAEAAAGTCPAASQIGTATAAAGAGSDPVSVQGQVYLTGPYNGGPFGEVVEVPAVAGPFNLGTVVVRGSIRINPTTAQASVVSDAFPTMLKEEGAGVPVTLKRVVVTLDRPGFTFNPTNCNQLAVTGKITGTGGASVPVSAPFQVANCAKLPFKPRFTVSTQAKSSKAGGASLRVKITSGAGQANLAKIKVDLPKQLPSRFSTLQKACLAAVFAANPASCPAGSLVGTAKAVTPVLKTPFRGPAYLVSHGGSGTPDLELVLQSEGVTLIQDGKTKIKNGITTSTFSTIPDAPISMIELTLPEGPHSALATFLPAKAKYNMCGQKLLMPTSITGQNGAVITQTTKIAVTGCPKKHVAKKGGKKKG